MSALVVPLSRGLVARISPEDVDLLRYKWHAHTSRKERGLPGRFYAARNNRSGVGPRLILLHRVIGERLGLTGVGNEVDHRDLDRLNDQRDNLRRASRQENARNNGLRRDNSTGFKGVSFDRRYGNFRAYIKLGRYVHLGCHRTAEDAARAYDRAAREHFGEFARLNFSETP